MIPTTLLAGLVLGRWWWVIMPISAAWALLLVSDGSVSVGAVALGALNAAVGVAIHQGVLALLRVLRTTARPETVETRAERLAE